LEDASIQFLILQKKKEMDRCQVLVISTHIGVLKYIPGEDMKSIWRVVLHMERNFFKSFLGRSVLFKKLNFGVGFLFTSKTWAYVSCTFSFLLAAVFVRLLYSPERLSSFFSVLTKERRLTRGVLHVISGVEA
jgi:hypothetical protein